MGKREAIAGVVFAAVLGAVVWSGCGDDSTAPASTIDETQAQQIGTSIAGQVGDLADAFTFTDPSQVPIHKAARMLGGASPFRDAALASRLLRAQLAGEMCATYSDTTDTDGDGVPNDLTVWFNSPACSTMVDSATVQLSGSFRVTDPGATPGFNIAYSNVRLRVAALDGDFFDVRWNGTQNVAATTTQATLNDNMTVALSARNGNQTMNGTLSQNWTAGYTVAEGQTFSPDADLPSGALTVSGSSNWSGPQGNFAFALSTTQPLLHSVTCTTDPRFDSGVVRAALTGSGGVIFIRIDFVGCGQDPIVTLVGRPTS